MACLVLSHHVLSCISSLLPFSFFLLLKKVWCSREMGGEDDADADADAVAGSYA